MPTRANAILVDVILLNVSSAEQSIVGAETVVWTRGVHLFFQLPVKFRYYNQGY